MPIAPPRRLLPLLALAQCAALIDHLAATGTVEREAMAHLLGRLLEPPLPDEHPLGKVEDYAIGREVLEDMLSGELPDNQRHIPAYMRAMAGLAHKLSRRPELAAQLRDRMDEAVRRREFLDAGSGSVHAMLSGIYGETLGQLNPTLSVSGALRQITDRHNGNVIRAIVLAGVQAAAVWRAEGGRSWQLRWRRRTILRCLKELEKA